MYLMLGGTHRTRVLEFETRQRMAMRIPVFVEWQNPVMFAVPPKDSHWHYVTVAAFWQN